MGTPQPLVTYLTLELWIALLLRDLQPLGLAPLGKVLDELGLPRTAMSAAVRHGLYNALRVMSVAGVLESADERTSYDTAEFPPGWSALQTAGDPVAIAAESKHLLDRLDQILEEDALSDDLLFRAMAASESIQTPTGLSNVSELASQSLRSKLVPLLPPDSVLLGLMARQDMLLDGMHYFLVEQLRVVPGVGQLIDRLETTDTDGASARVEARRDELSRRAQEERIEIRRRIWQEKTGCLEEAGAQLATMIDVAVLMAHRRQSYYQLFEPVLIELETLFRRSERGPTEGPPGLAPGHMTRSIKRFGTIEEGAEAPALSQAPAGDPLLLFHRANKAFRDGLNRKAIRDYEKAIEANPTMAEAHFNLCQARIRVGQLRPALEAYRAAIELESKLRMLPPEFELLAFTAVDGFGLICKVRDERSQSIHSARLIKPSLASEEGRVEQFIAGLKGLQKVRAKEIIRPIAVHKHRQHLITISDVVEGSRLSDVLAAGPLPRRRVARVLEGLCSCLARCHAEGLIHGCLRPSCIVLDEDGGVRIDDFNMWLLLEGHHDEPGMPTDHLAPEQMAQITSASPASDVYAISAILFELLTGVPWARRAEREYSAAEADSAGEVLQRGLEANAADRCTVDELAGAIWTLTTSK